jgi:hypothetical protein
VPPYQRQDLPLGFQPSWHLFHRRLLRFYALIPTPLHPPPNLLKYPLRRIELRRVGRLIYPPQPHLSHRLRLVKSRMALYHALSTCPLPCSEYLLNRLAAAHHLFHPLQSLPSSQHPQRLPSLGYPSISLLLVKLVKHSCWMLPSSLQWPCYTYLALGGVRIRLTGNGISSSIEVADKIIQRCK